MTAEEIIELLRQNNVHVYTNTFAGKQETFIEGRIEYFENFVKALGESCVSICDSVNRESYGAETCKTEIQSYFDIGE